MRDVAEESAALAVVEGGGPGVLARVADPGCAAAIWQRDMAATTRGWLEGLPPGRLPALRDGADVGTTAARVDAACDVAGVPQGRERRLLCGDVQALATRFGRIMGVPRVALRLDVVTGDACRRFHLDHVAARLLCTYRGCGTEYGIAGPEGPPAEIRRMRPGWVGIFRGALWPGDARSGVVHRSPPIAGRGETRLLLVIDMPEAP